MYFSIWSEQCLRCLSQSGCFFYPCPVHFGQHCERLTLRETGWLAKHWQLLSTCAILECCSAFAMFVRASILAVSYLIGSFWLFFRSSLCPSPLVTARFTVDMSATCCGLFCSGRRAQPSQSLIFITCDFHYVSENGIIGHITVSKQWLQFAANIFTSVTQALVHCV